MILDRIGRRHFLIWLLFNYGHVIRSTAKMIILDRKQIKQSSI